MLPVTIIGILFGAVVGEDSTEIGECEFDSMPVGVGYYWDPNCKPDDLGCDGDGKNLQCRLCGGGDFLSVPCPASSCKFAAHPYVPYFWDPECTKGGLGCWADGHHAQCRFCGDHPYTGIPCPEGAEPVPAVKCSFAVEPTTPHFVDPTCTLGMHGCFADGVNVRCRFCGGDGFSDIHCPGSQVCEFPTLPTRPYYWDPECKEGMLGCKADDVHAGCRFCAEPPFEAIPCPEPQWLPAGFRNECTWPERGEPVDLGYFWDESCERGMLGCWADGLHAQCRYCGSGDFSEIACPTGTSGQSQTAGSTAASPTSPSPSQHANSSRYGSDDSDPNDELNATGRLRGSSP